MPPLSTLNKTALTLAVTQAVAMSSAQAATIRVNDFSDDFASTNCTLREAISSANTDSVAAGSNCVPGSGDDVIRFDNTAPQTIGLTQGALYITTDIEIRAPFHNPIVVDGSDNDLNRANFEISNAYVTLDHLNIRGAQGVGVQIQSSSVTISNSQVYDGENTGISNSGSNSSLNIINSTISNNKSNGIRHGEGILTITSSTISNNTAYRGGGLFVGYTAEVIINASTITSNTAMQSGGGIETNSFNISLTISNSIISGNNSPNYVEVMGGSTDTLNSNNSLFGSSATTNAEAFNYFAPSATDINANNTDGLNIALAGILDPILTDNGGPTHTHNLVTGSAAINKISGAACDNRDQRNEGRSITCDIGAVEYLTVGQTIVVDTPMANSTAVGTCSLNQAIQTVNNNREYGNCEIGGINDVISFDSAIDSVTLTAELPTITADVSVQGDGATIDADGVARVLNIAGGSKVELDDLVVTGGLANIDAGVAVGFDTDVTITNSTITGNTSSSSSGGLAVSNYSALRVIDSTVSNNLADLGGGVSASTGSLLKIERSTVSGNSASFYFGGGVTVSGLGTNASFNNSTITGNIANTGGSIVAADGAIASVANSTVVNNTAVLGEVGGVISDSDSEISVQNSIISNPGFFEIAAVRSGQVNSLGNNLIGESSKTNAQSLYSVMPASTDITAASDGTDPTAATDIFDPLSDNGGPTLTHALVSESPAIDAANSVACPANDQRGEMRGSSCDIGAFEVEEEGDSSFFVVPLPNGKSVIFGL